MALSGNLVKSFVRKRGGEITFGTKQLYFAKKAENFADLIRDQFSLHPNVVDHEHSKRIKKLSGLWTTSWTRKSYSNAKEEFTRVLYNFRRLKVSSQDNIGLLNPQSHPDSYSADEYDDHEYGYQSGDNRRDQSLPPEIRYGGLLLGNSVKYNPDNHTSRHHLNQNGESLSTIFPGRLHRPLPFRIRLNCRCIEPSIVQALLTPYLASHHNLDHNLEKASSVSKLRIAFLDWVSIIRQEQK
ncbi:hypothetical protein J6590_065309 [Homalodisca vitripennis]|nr:hypothetical protein J6590_065309 [Homalodisca vitripennis]